MRDLISDVNFIYSLAVFVRYVHIMQMM